MSQLTLYLDDATKALVDQTARAARFVQKPLGGRHLPFNPPKSSPLVIPQNK